MFPVVFTIGKHGQETMFLHCLSTIEKLEKISLFPTVRNIFLATGEHTWETYASYAYLILAELIGNGSLSFCLDFILSRFFFSCSFIFFSLFFFFTHLHNKVAI